MLVPAMFCKHRGKARIHGNAAEKLTEAKSKSHCCPIVSKYSRFLQDQQAGTFPFVVDWHELMNNPEIPKALSFSFPEASLILHSWSVLL